MDRYDQFLSKYIPKYLDNQFIDEIVICDENGNDVEKIMKTFNNDKLKLHINKKRLGPFLNKLCTCQKAKNQWIALIDSDNFVDIEYFETIQKYLNKLSPSIKGDFSMKNSILSPSFAKPNFDFKYLEGKVFKKGEFDNLKQFEKMAKRSKKIRTIHNLMNTGNYVINKFLIDHLDLTNESSKQQENIYFSPYDVIYLNTLLFEQLDMNFHVVPGLSYIHTIHDDSIYLKTYDKFEDFFKYIHQRYNNLK